MGTQRQVRKLQNFTANCEYMHIIHMFVHVPGTGSRWVHFRDIRVYCVYMDAAGVLIVCTSRYTHTAHSTQGSTVTGSTTVVVTGTRYMNR